MKVIFLDIDGVLNSTRSCAALGGYPFPDVKKDRDWHLFDPVAVGLLSRACDKTGAVCVLSSSWRMLMDTEEIKELAHHLGVKIIDKTKNSIGNEPRGEQIQEWMECNENAKDITHYAILDDDADMLDCQMENFVRTNSQEGFLFENYMKLTMILGGENE